jgi:hypothetical protein
MTLYLVPFLFDPDEPTTTASVLMYKFIDMGTVKVIVVIFSALRFS